MSRRLPGGLAEDSVLPASPAHSARPLRARTFFGAGSGDRTAVVNATFGLAKTPRRSTSPWCSGLLLPQLAAVFPDEPVIDRTKR